MEARSLNIILNLSWKRIYLIILAKWVFVARLKKCDIHHVNLRKQYFQTVKINSY